LLCRTSPFRLLDDVVRFATRLRAHETTQFHLIGRQRGNVAAHRRDAQQQALPLIGQRQRWS
jgi:hypothetical protein